MTANSYKDQADEQLMQLITKGDQLAFSELYDRYGRIMINYFYRMLWKDREKAEDFMQDLFMKIVNKPQLYDPKRPFKTWIYSVANNMCKNEYRKQEVRKNTSSGLDESWNVSNNDRDQISKVDDHIFTDRLNEELDKLDEKQRTTFVLRFHEEMSIKEIAEIFDCSEGTVKSRIFYTLKKLSEGLEEFNPKAKEIEL